VGGARSLERGHGHCQTLAVPRPANGVGGHSGVRSNMIPSSAA
jgi:hypothetical protein